MHCLLLDNSTKRAVIVSRRHCAEKALRNCIKSVGISAFANRVYMPIVLSANGCGEIHSQAR